MAASSIVFWSHRLRRPLNVESKPFEFRSCIRNFSRTLDSNLAIPGSYSGEETICANRCSPKADCKFKNDNHEEEHYDDRSMAYRLHISSDFS